MNSIILTITATSANRSNATDVDMSLTDEWTESFNASSSTSSSTTYVPDEDIVGNLREMFFYIGDDIDDIIIGALTQCGGDAIAATDYLFKWAEEKRKREATELSLKMNRRASDDLLSNGLLGEVASSSIHSSTVASNSRRVSNVNDSLVNDEPASKLSMSYSTKRKRKDTSNSRQSKRPKKKARSSSNDAKGEFIFLLSFDLLCNMLIMNS
jgi:hypothetical protein